MKELKTNEFYSREEVHDIFSPETKFLSRRGSWGLRGIVKIPEREGDFVFFVTYGQSQGDHTFEEGITSDGVLTWQSQPRQNFKSEIIQSLINHDESENNIYLFLREYSRGRYQYLGKLKYLNHDKDREKPVHFQWQLLDPIAIEEIKERQEGLHKVMEARLNQLGNDSNQISDEIETLDSIDESSSMGNLDNDIGEIKITTIIPSSKKMGVSKSDFKATKAPDYAAKEIKNKKLGLIGEKLVLNYEIDQLLSNGLEDLANKVVHTSMIEGDGAGYDIKSFDDFGNIKYIEVKTTRGSINTDFYMSPREILFSKKHPEKFYLYRVFNLDEQNNGEFYVFKGDIEENFNKIPTGFRLSKK
tara:strand:- start:173 stop:1249 length:1077 start_codon:yes stop_codon:yes gene_type:complete